MTLIPIDLVYAQDPDAPRPVWSVDLCVGWDRVAQLQADSFTFDAVERAPQAGEWALSFPDRAGSWGSRKVPDLPNYLRLDGAGSVATSDNAATSVTGDIDVRWFGSLDDWTSGAEQTLVAKWAAGGNQRSWRLGVNGTGEVIFVVSGNGSSSTSSTAVSVPAADRQAIGIRVTRVQSSGLVTTYFSTDEGASWVSAGTSTVLATTAMFDSTRGIDIGAINVGTFGTSFARVYWVEVWNGIEGSGGAVVAAPDFSDLVAGPGQNFTDAYGNVWRCSPAASIIGDPLVEMVEWKPTDIDTVRLVEDGKIRFAGVVGDPFDTGSGGCTMTKDAGVVRWMLSGPDLYGDVLSSRIAFPTPTVGTATWTDATDDRTGLATTVLAQYLSYNLASDALTARRYTGLTVTDTTDGPTITWSSARLQPLLELVDSICRAHGLIVRATADSAGQVELLVELTRDLSASRILFDASGDLQTLSVRTIPAKATWVVAGGAGEGSSRTFAVSAYDATGSDRRERFVDVAQASDAGQVSAEALTALRLSQATWSVSAVSVDEPSAGWQFGRHVLVGDIVTVDAGGRRFPVPVTEIIWHVDAERPYVRATLGDAAPNALKALQRRLAQLEARNVNQIA